MEITFKKFKEMQFKQLGDAKYKQRLGFPLTSYEENILSIFGDRFDKSNGSVDTFVKNTLGPSDYNKKYNLYGKTTTIGDDGAKRAYRYHEGATDFPKDYMARIVNDWKARGGEKAVSMFKSAVDYVKNINNNPNEKIPSSEMGEINDLITSGRVVEVPINDISDMWNRELAERQQSDKDIAPAYNPPKTTSTVHPDLKEIAKVAVGNVKKAWDIKETQKINEITGLNMSNADRVAVGRQYFGKDYRGTNDQNTELAKRLKEFADKQGTSSNGYSQVKVEEPFKESVDNVITSSGDWFDEYMNGK